MDKMKQWIVLWLVVCGLLLGPTSCASGKDSSAQLGEATRLNKQAIELGNAGRYDEAVLLAERALAIREKALGEEDPAVAQSLNNLAFLYEEIGDYVRAEPLFLRALVIYEKVDGAEHSDIALCLNNLAGLYRAKGDNPRAESLFKRALTIREKALGVEHPDVAQSLNNLAEMYKGKGDYAHAEPLLKRALAIIEKAYGAEHPTVAGLLNNLAALYDAKGDYSQAEPLYQRALAIKEKSLGAEHPSVALSLNNLATLYREKGDYARAEPLYQRALAINEKVYGAEHPTVAALLSNLAALYQVKGDYTRAVQFLRRVEEISEHNLSLILATGSENQKQLYISSLFGGTDVIVSLHVRSAPANEQAAQLAVTTILRRKGRALDAMTDQIALLRHRAAPEDQKLLDELARARSQLATLQLSRAGQLAPEARREEVEELAADVEAMEDELSRRSIEIRAQAQSVTLDAVRQVIPADAALVEICSYQPFNIKAKNDAEKFGAWRYVAYVVRHDTPTPQWVELGEAVSLEAKVERLRVALKDPRRADVQTIARVLDEQVMRPIRKLLGPARHLFLSPDGMLNLIPFAALVDENGKYLIENYSLTYLTSGRDLLRLQVHTESRDVPMVLANPLYDMPATPQDNQPSVRNDENRRSLDFTLLNYKPLVGTAEEAAVLAQLWPDARVLTQDTATESALKQVRSPRVLHIATHGFFLADQPRDLPTDSKLRRETIDSSPLPERWENPLLRSGLILAGVKQHQSGAGEDGVLTAMETAGLDLWGTKLVVLSACETGLGDVWNGAGVYGLRRALVLAGSETQVMSLWKVSDAGTRDLMTAYYTRLQAGEGRTEALRQVQLAMLRGQLSATTSGRQRETSDTGEKAATKDYRHPYYWAAFIPSGDWRNMDGK